MIIAHLLVHLGVPGGVATGTAIAVMRLKRGLGPATRSTRHGRRR
jgi:hypothetical protein